MKLKVTTMPVLTQAQRETLQRLGCEAKPFLSWTYALVFAADCTNPQVLRCLEYVTDVQPMPVYKVSRPE